MVEQIGDENANVVIGTVIDPEMSDRLCDCGRDRTWRCIVSKNSGR